VSTDLRPLYMWAGGKTKLIKSYRGLWPGMADYDNYVEPFFGGGAIYAWINNDPGAGHIRHHIGDINTELMGVITAIKTDPDRFVRSTQHLARQMLKLKTKDQRKAWYYDQRRLYWARPTPSRLYVLMRTGFNGIWQTCADSAGLFGTPAGLLNQTRLDQIVDRDLVRDWSKALQHTEVHAGSYETMALPDQGRTLFYLDPPYRDSFTTYSTGFSDADQDRLTKWFAGLVGAGHTVLMSNRCVPGDSFFEDRLGDIADFHYIDVVYTAGRRKVTAEGFEAKPAQEILIVSR